MVYFLFSLSTLLIENFPTRNFKLLIQVCINSASNSLALYSVYMLLIPLGSFGLSWQQKVRPKLKPFPVACSCRATFDRYGEDGLKGNVRRHSASDHAFNNSNHFTGFPTGRNIWKQFFKIFRSGTAEGIWDRFIVSSIKSKFDDLFFIHLLVFVWFAELAEQFQARNLYKTCKSTKNWLSNFCLKFSFSWKATKIPSKCQNHEEDCANFCGLPRKAEL